MNEGTAAMILLAILAMVVALGTGDAIDQVLGAGASAALLTGGLVFLLALLVGRFFGRTINERRDDGRSDRGAL